jgi:hypothetical protein
MLILKRVSAYRESGGIIAIKGFSETEFKNKQPINYCDIETKSGGIKTSCSVITIQPHEKLKAYSQQNHAVNNAAG